MGTPCAVAFLPLTPITMPRLAASDTPSLAPESCAARRLDSFALLVFSDLAPPAPVGGPGRACRRLIDAIEAPHLDFLGGGLRRDVVVQHLGFGLLDVIVDDDADDDVLVAAEGPADAKTIAFADGAVGFGGLAVDVDLSALAGALGFRSRLEEARDVQPDVETNLLAQIKISTLL